MSYEDCGICCRSFCLTDVCGSTKTRTSCCGQHICCACVVRNAMPCSCKHRCREVVTVCPFCRRICRISSLAIYLAGASRDETCGCPDD